MSMLRPLARTSAFTAKDSLRRVAMAAGARRSVFLDAVPYGSSKMPSQSSDDAAKPTALAKLYLEDGTTLLAKSFGCHKSVEGEVSGRRQNRVHVLCSLYLLECAHFVCYCIPA